jgi:hypothetical protein
LAVEAPKHFTSPPENAPGSKSQLNPPSLSLQTMARSNSFKFPHRKFSMLGSNASNVEIGSQQLQAILNVFFSLLLRRMA